MQCGPNIVAHSCWFSRRVKGFRGPSNMDTDSQQASFLPDFCGTRIVFVVVLVAELLAIVLTLAQPPYVTERLFELGMYSLFIQWIALCCVGCLCLCRPYLNHLPDHWVATLSYSITLAVSFMMTELAWWLISEWPAIGSYSHYDHKLFLARSMGISAIVCAVALRYFYVQHQWRNRLKSETEARLQALQSRIRPHFLFNCLNTIASLTRRQPALAEQAIEDLSDLFRVSLQDSRQSSTLQDEITLCERYLRIEQHRLGDRLHVDWQLNAVPMDAILPALSLQPLLENAIYHGIESLANGGLIRLTARAMDNSICITIENPVPEPTTPGQQRTGNHIALENISQRLSAFFGQSRLLQVAQVDNHYRVTLTIPYPYENTDRR